MGGPDIVTLPTEIEEAEVYLERAAQEGCGALPGHLDLGVVSFPSQKTRGVHPESLYKE